MHRRLCVFLCFCGILRVIYDFPFFIPLIELVELRCKMLTNLLADGILFSCRRRITFDEFAVGVTFGNHICSKQKGKKE